MAPTHNTSPATPAEPGEMDADPDAGPGEIPATRAEIDAAILALLAPTGDELVRWHSISRRVPGTWWQKLWALTRLYDAGRVFTMKIGGTPYVSLADDCDAEIAAKYRAKRRTRPPLIV